MVLTAAKPAALLRNVTRQRLIPQKGAFKHQSVSNQVRNIQQIPNNTQTLLPRVCPKRAETKTRAGVGLEGLLGLCSLGDIMPSIPLGSLFLASALPVVKVALLCSVGAICAAKVCACRGQLACTSQGIIVHDFHAGIISASFHEDNLAKP